MTCLNENEKNPLKYVWLPKALEIQNSLFSIRVVCSNLITALLHFSVMKHEHEFYEMHYITDGDVVLELEDDKVISLSKGDFVVLRPSVQHRIRCTKQESEKFGFSFYLDSAEDDIMKALQTLTEDYAVWKGTDQMDLLLQTMINTSSNNYNEINRMIMHHLLEAFFLEVLGIVLTDGLAIKKEGPILLGKNDVLENAKIYIALNADRPLSVEEVADKMYFSTRQFARIVRSRCGCTPSALIAQARIDYIKKLLRETPMSVTEIAESTGFKDASSIVKFFKGHTGITPIAYRKEKNMS